MKKSILALFLALVLVLTAALPAAGADGLRDKLRNLKEKVEAAVTGGDKADGSTSVTESLISKLLAKLKESFSGQDADQVLGEILAGITDKDGNIDIDSLMALIGMFTSGGTETAAEAAEDGEGGESPYIQALRNQDKAIEAHIMEEYKDMVEPGDVTIVIPMPVANEDDGLQEILGYYGLWCFTVDGKDLKFKSFAGAPEFMAFSIDDDMNFEVVEAVRAEDGENYSASVDALCERYRVTRATFDSSTSGMSREWGESFHLFDYLENHPEYERIEYKGEMKTKEEMEAISDDCLGAIFDEAFGDIGSME